ncbi:hypothetical protein SCLCIDRAFT_12192 [Scleroderma citrinum Foug A]|uniref:Uncharacterized protein n=1 Tax=Scleroderma citrinum Foug A TaxID=1036808 RepID=A0A0C2YN71_9AGAM|nr:hypothetical protein SCLCIDRAFT_12192 [Scleroderma citrinum Foug A]
MSLKILSSIGDSAHLIVLCKCWVSSTPETPEIVPMTYLIGCELLSSTFAMPDNLILLVICTEQEDVSCLITSAIAHGFSNSILLGIGVATGFTNDIVCTGGPENYNFYALRRQINAILWLVFVTDSWTSNIFILLVSWLNRSLYVALQV